MMIFQVQILRFDLYRPPFEYREYLEQYLNLKMNLAIFGIFSTSGYNVLCQINIINAIGTETLL